MLVISTSLLLGARPLLAQDAAKDPSAKEAPPVSIPITPSEEPSLFAFGDKNPACAEWGDTCQICQRGADGAVSCSTSGIACMPAKLVCLRPVAVSKSPADATPLPKVPEPAKPEPAKPAAPEPMFPESSSPY